MIRVGIPILFTGEHWMGGINYFNSLLSAINELPVCNLKVIVLTNDKKIFEKHISERIQIVIANKNSRSKFFFKRIINRVFDLNIDLTGFIKDNHIDVVTHVQPSSFYKAKTIWWKPDFQEKYYPEYFTDKDIKLRNKAVLKSIKNKKIIFSSLDARNDFKKFYSNPPDIFSPVLRFVPYLNKCDFDEDDLLRSKVMEKYGLDKPYFFLPNQFWAHKNHELVFRAMQEISSDVYLVATGSMNDYRNRNHIELLKTLVYESKGKIKTPGLIPRDEMICLMKHSIAVINPSRFEGWSTTVEESKYLGKRMILSSLNVHIEQDPPESIYIDCEDIAKMSHAIDVVYNQFEAVAENVRREKAMKLYLSSKEKFAKEYVDLVFNVYSMQ